MGYINPHSTTVHTLCLRKGNEYDKLLQVITILKQVSINGQSEFRSELRRQADGLRDAASNVPLIIGLSKLKESQNMLRNNFHLQYIHLTII